MADGGVHESPGSAVQGLTNWAVDLWPYINGKALMSGIDLEELEASQTLDVLHYLFEEDTHHQSEESISSRSTIRVALYRDFYHKEYKYPYVSKKASTESYQTASATDFGTFSEEQAEMMSVNPFDPKRRETKPYIPPTVLDANSADPLGLGDPTSRPLSK